MLPFRRALLPYLRNSFKMSPIKYHQVYPIEVRRKPKLLALTHVSNASRLGSNQVNPDLCTSFRRLSGLARINYCSSQQTTTTAAQYNKKKSGTEDSNLYYVAVFERAKRGS